MTLPTWSRRVLPLSLLASALLVGPTLAAQVSRRPTAADVTREPLDTAAILASARPEIDAANADSGLFVAGDGTVTRGRVAVTRMYAERFPRLRPIRAGAVVQDGLTVLGPTRIAEWGHAWLDLVPEDHGEAPTRSGGTYLTVWQREADGHWRIVRNLAF